MKKQLLIAALLFSVTVSAGCQTASSPSGGTLPMSTAASAVGWLAMGSSTSSVIGSPVGVSSLGIRPLVASYSFDSDGWLVMTLSQSVSGVGSFAYDIKTELTGKTTGAIDSAAKLLAFNTTHDSLESMFIYSRIACDLTSPEVMSFTVTSGNSKTDPLKFEHMNSAAQTITGPAAYSGTYGGVPFSVSLNYGGLSVNSSTKYPSGSVTFSVASGTTAAYSGTITFNGTTTATIVFSGGGTYTLNLLTGAVS